MIGFKAFAPTKDSGDATISVMGDCDAAQAVELIRALRDQLHEMTTQLARVERQVVLRVDTLERPGTRDAVGSRQAAPRHASRDMQEAQALIDRLQRRYLNGDERTQQHPAGRQPLASAPYTVVKC